MTDVQLRPVRPDDLPILFEHQADEEAARMASFTPRDRDAFMAHWTRIARNPAGIARAVVVDGEVVGNVVSWEDDRDRLVGYWIGREHWGRGFGTAALTAFLEVDRTRPLRAFVADQNVGSIRVLEKCGFVRVGTIRREGDVTELIYELRSAGASATIA